MLKVRVLPTLLYKETGLVKGKRFDSWRIVGSAVQAIRVYSLREVDELIFLDIAATPNGSRPDLEMIDDLADDCCMPLTVGGGVRSIEDVQGLLRVGADKVSIGTAAVETPELVREASRRFGSQCIVVSIDALRTAERHEVRVRCGTRPTGLDPVHQARRAEDLGAGEILLTSIDRDGTLEGYDVDLIRKVSQAVAIPVIASGGAGTCGHMVQAVLEGGASAVAAGSMFHFTQQTPLAAKRCLAENGVRVRL